MFRLLYLVIYLQCPQLALSAIYTRHLNKFIIINDDTLITIYNSLIQPSFVYCDMVWDNLSKDLATRLQKLQNRAGKVILRAAFNVSSKDVLEKLGWSDLR